MIVRFDVLPVHPECPSTQRLNCFPSSPLVSCLVIKLEKCSLVLCNKSSLLSSSSSSVPVSALWLGRKVSSHSDGEEEEGEKKGTSEWKVLIVRSVCVCVLGCAMCSMFDDHTVDIAGQIELARCDGVQTTTTVARK